MCRDFDENFQKVPCVWALWCGVETLKFFIVPMCVCSVVWCAEFEFFQSSPSVSSVVLSGEFECFQSSPVCGLCDVESLNFFKVPLCMPGFCGVGRL